MQVRIPHRELVPDNVDYDDVDLIVTIETDWGEEGSELEFEEEE